MRTRIPRLSYNPLVMRMLPLLVVAGYAALWAGPARPDSAAKPTKPTKMAKAERATVIPAKASVKKDSAAAAPAKASGNKDTVAVARPRETRREESGRTPSLGARPDTSFARASEWESGEAEVLEYAVKRMGPDGEIRGRGRLVTERLSLRPDGSTSLPAAGAPYQGRPETEILNAALWEEGADGAPFSGETVCQFPRAGGFGLLRQEQSLQGWPGTTHRSLDCRPQPPRLRIASSGAEPQLDTVLTRWPVYTEQMLFTYLRAIPQRTGYREEVWLQDWGREGRFDPVPRYASITVRAKASGVRDLDTWNVIVERDDGRRSEFWVGASGLHPVIVADLCDGSEWTLEGISRKEYRDR